METDTPVIGNVIIDNVNNLVGVVLKSNAKKCASLTIGELLINWFNLGVFVTPAHLVEEAFQTGEWILQPNLKTEWGWEFPRDKNV